VINILKVMENFRTIPLPDTADANAYHMDIREGQPTPTQPEIAVNHNQGWTASNKGKAPSTRPASQPRQSDGATSPERQAYIAPADPNRIRTRHINKLQPLAEEHSQGLAGHNDRVRKDSVYDASSSRGARKEILAMMGRYEPDKSKQAKLLT
jgi:hypothetical protein